MHPIASNKRPGAYLFRAPFRPGAYYKYYTDSESSVECDETKLNRKV